MLEICIFEKYKFAALSIPLKSERSLIIKNASEYKFNLFLPLLKAINADYANFIHVF